MTTTKSKYLAAQAAGSCRIEGLKVSASEEELMSKIISGELDADTEIQRVLEEIRNASTKDQNAPEK